MAWLSRVNFISSDTLSFTDINNLGNDIRAWGGNVNGGGYTLSNVVLSASAGTMATVIGGTGTTSTLTLRSTSGVGTTGADIIFQAGTNGASEIMRLLNGGNVLINRASTDSPANKLDVQSTSVRFYSGGSTTDTIFHVGNSDVAGGQGGLITFHASAATPYLSINAISQGVAHRNISLAPSGGNVGIGATSPATKLHVLTANPGAANEVARFQGGTNNSNFRNYISCYTTNVGFWWELSNEDSAGTGSSNGFAFRERSGADPSVVRLYLASGGNVGIGTSSPATSAKLEIAGTTGALLVPRLTTTERNALTAVNGMIIYNTTDNQMQGRINGAWVAM